MPIKTLTADAVKDEAFDPKFPYIVTRWCCTSGDCIYCHERRDRGEVKGFDHKEHRTRIVQGKGLTKKRAESYFDGWNCHGYEPKIEKRTK